MKTNIANTIKLEKFYAYPIGDVWRAISEAEAISEWFIQADFKAEVGYAYQFKHEGTVVSGEVLAVDPPRELVYTWRVDSAPVATTVKWQLEPQAKGTRLVLEHSGFEHLKETAVDMFNASKTGWEAVMIELAGYLDGRR